MASGGVSITSFASVLGAPVRIASESFSFAFSLTTGIGKKYLKKRGIKRNSITKLLCYPEVN